MSVVLLPAATLLLLVASPVAANEEPPLDDFEVRVGGFVTHLDSIIRLDDPRGRRGSDIDFDDELGLQDRDVIEIVSFDWRPWRRHEFGIEWFHESLSGTRMLQHEIDYGGEHFGLDTRVFSALILESTGYHYTYWPALHDDWALGMRFGFLDYRLSTRIEALFSESGDDGVIGVRVRTYDTLPVPSFGLDFRYRLSEHWRMNASLGWFKAKLNRVSPVVANAHVGIEFLAWENVGLWADLGLNDLDAEYRSELINGRFRLEEGGLRVGVSYRL